MSEELGPDWWSWQDIVERADQLGIPNFQRGAVWDSANRVALLESIYEQSPCGSFVLWRPEDDGGDRDRLRHGVPVREFAPDKAPMWLVDGQQRTRAMLDIFHQLIATPPHPDGWSPVRQEDLADLRQVGRALVDCVGATDDGDEEPDSEHDRSDDSGGSDSLTWYVVLPAMQVFERNRNPPLFGELGESRKVQRGSMFRRLRPHARVPLRSDGTRRAGNPHPVGLVPLASLVAPTSVFQRMELRAHVTSLLHRFADEDFPAAELDALLPWGPQFVTGYAYEGTTSDGKLSMPITWSHIHRRRGEEFVGRLVRILSDLFSEEWRPVFARLGEMLSGDRFAVGWLPPGDVSSAIDAYVRINRAGIQVRADERALALLSRAHPGLLDDLAEFYRRRDPDRDVRDQRELLTHESDKLMGFSLWMTTVTRYSALALLGTSARRWLGVSAIDRSTFAYRLDRVGESETDEGKKTWARQYRTAEELVRECAERASCALLLIDSVLSNELALDHRMARPSTLGLTPIIDLFYRVPASAIERLQSHKFFRQALARLLHWTLLHPTINQADREQLVLDVHGIDEESAKRASGPLSAWPSDESRVDKELRSAFLRYQHSLLARYSRVGGGPLDDAAISRGIQETLAALALGGFALSMEKARTLQHPAVGWLYALERRGGAKEFLWAAQFERFAASGKREGAPPPDGVSREEVPLQRWTGSGSEELYPEKQHIVPFSAARRISGAKGSRATASDANVLGNLTWLSRRQNGFDGLSDRWAAMDCRRDDANLRARGMFASVENADANALKVYKQLLGMWLDESWKDDSRGAGELYAAFCSARLAWMREQMRAWLMTPLSPDARGWLEG